MIEIIALAASAVLVPALAAFAWIAKKRLDDLQDEDFALTDDLKALSYKYESHVFHEKILWNRWDEIKKRVDALDGKHDLKILRKAGEE